ncbi:MAG: S-methyl-5'-thioadenosine phosphorylase [Chloroflexi bacterium]|nr:S-methyl-5'-thioadenosine phosphorylase [Chloroflexota bacterium]
MPSAIIGVIGGTGLSELSGLTDVQEINVNTPFGAPSGPIVVGSYHGVEIAFLSRHGVGHRLTPTELPVRANIYALKLLGVERVISISAVGSLREEMAPQHMVVPDQLIDRTRQRVSSFFGDGIVAHVSFAEPFCPTLRHLLVDACREAEATVHDGGAYVVMEGPAFSTVAESQLYRSWGAGVIGMTALPEAKLAREAELCYGTLACVTDYDVWHPDHDSVTVEVVLRNLHHNVATAQAVLQTIVPQLTGDRDCPCGHALDMAVVTAPDARPEGAKQRLKLLLGDRA